MGMVTVQLRIVALCIVIVRRHRRRGGGAFF